MKLIEDSSELKLICQKLSNEEYITVDTEFLRERTYYPKLCLIQIASENEAFIVDPLAENINLSPVFEVFNNKNIVKVFHSARQDIEIIVNLSGKVPEPLFDTQVAAMVCGFGECAGYANLVSSLVGEEIDKSSRFTDWSKRPLTAKQLDYAISDVTHLRDVYKKIKVMLKEEGRESWLKEEMNVLLDIDSYRINPDEVWKKLKTRTSSRSFLAIVRELAKWREIRSMEIDKPRGFVLKDTVLLEVAAVIPKNIEELKSIRGIGSLKESLAQEIVDSISYASSLDDSDLPELREKKKTSKSDDAFINMLKLLLKIQASKFNVAEKIVASSSDIVDIAIGDDAKGAVFQGWRNEIFGQYVSALKNGEIALSYNEGKINICNI